MSFTKYLYAALILISGYVKADDCGYGKETASKKSLKQLQDLSLFIKRHETVNPWIQCHYNGRSVSCEEYERLVQSEVSDPSVDPSLRMRNP
ncbi:MAG TPA: hypothetical protein PKI14_01605 [Fervidobacterium sp.]|nr:hypothetical protein [Fervidobacterium sp.]